ncbi:MAG: sigma-E processing peptidase SpoIIGA [Lachnospiraceae bacterium]|nr:sigma-E processing peptidase SpoIIGA [Lachnospiraceae bacterium]
MAITLYLDVFFLVNFGMDYLLLSLVNYLLHLSSPWWRLALSSLLGGVWACLNLLFQEPSGWAAFLLAWLGLGTAMVIVAFGTGRRRCCQPDKRRWHDWLNFHHVGSCLVAFWLVSVMAGGIFDLLGDQMTTGYYLSGTRAVCQWKLFPLCLLAAGIYFGILACLKLVRKKAKEQAVLCQVKLSYRGTERVVTALWDTGNQLYEPYGGQPVHVVTKSVSLALCKTVPQIIYIPFRTVDSEYAMMPGIRIDFMEVEKEGGGIRHYDRPWLAISKRPLSSDNRYEMLLHGSKR